MPDYNYRLRAGHTDVTIDPPQFAFVNNTNSSAADQSDRKQCFIQFDIPYDLEPTVLLYYKLTNYFQNHRRYVKSINMNQLKGDFVSKSTIDGGDCKPITSDSQGRIIYPCGLIANSVFNGTCYSGPLKY